MPIRETHQNFNEPVGNVFNFDGLLGGGSVPDKAVLAPTLVNRGAQINPLVERLEAMLPQGGTLLVVVPALDADYPDALIDRCGLVEFILRFGGIGSWRYLQRREWPEGNKSVGQILRGIRDALGLDKALGHADIERNVAALGRHLCFAHFVDEDDWEADGGALVRAWSGYLANGGLAPGSGCLVVAFLCFVTGEAPTASRRQIEGYIDTLRQGAGETDGVVLVSEPLGLIRDKHVRDWRTQVADYLDDPVIGTELVTVADQLFSTDRPKRRLREIWEQLCDAVTKAVKRRPARFAE